MVDDTKDKDVTELTPLNVAMNGIILKDDDTDQEVGFGAMFQLYPLPSKQCVEMVMNHVHGLIMADIKTICTMIAQHELAVPESEKPQ